jgi:hypothetical protein
MQNATQEMDDLIRQVKTGSAFESLAAAEKVAELSRARRASDTMNRFADELRRGFNAVPAPSDRFEQRSSLLDEVDQDFFHLGYVVNLMMSKWSDDPSALRRLKLYLDKRSKEIDDHLASRPSVERTAG